MLRAIITSEAIDMLGISERLSEYILRAIGEFSTEESHEIHMMAIEISYMTHRILCDSYHGQEAIEDTLNKANILLDGIFGSDINS